MIVIARSDQLRTGERPSAHWSVECLAVTPVLFLLLLCQEGPGTHRANWLLAFKATSKRLESEFLRFAALGTLDGFELRHELLLGGEAISFPCIMVGSWLVDDDLE